MTPVDIFLYLLGAFVVSNLILIWKNTLMPLHIYKVLKGKHPVETYEEWENVMILEYGLIGELLTCPLCLGTHLSWIVGLIITLVAHLSYWFILAGTFSWPLFAYMAYKLTKD
jgi:hypothetical protein